MATVLVKRISYDEAHPWVLKKHYARRIPSITYAFGVYEDGVLTGVVTFGVAPNYLLPVGLFGRVVGDEMKQNVLELNRLIVDTETKNIPSQLITGAFKLLPHGTVLVSYADSGLVWDISGTFTKQQTGYIRERQRSILRKLRRRGNIPDTQPPTPHTR